MQRGVFAHLLHEDIERSCRTSANPLGDLEADVAILAEHIDKATCAIVKIAKQVDGALG